jgi:hypothetical protein
MNTAKFNLVKIIKENYCFIYQNEEINSKEELKEAIANGLNLEHLEFDRSEVSDKLFDRNSCDFEQFSDICWLCCEDTPDNLVWSDYQEEYINIDYSLFCWVNRRNQSYIDINSQNCYQYQEEWYLSEVLGEFDLHEYNGEVYHSDDMRYCEDIGEYLPDDECYWCDDTEEYYADQSNANKGGLKQYHQSEIKDKSANAKIKIGFEVEKEDSNFKEFANIRALNWDAERDGSLNSNGFELVSAIYNLEDLTQFKQDTEQIKDYLNADSSKNCGGHINVSIKDKTNKEVFNLIRGYVPLVYAMYFGRLDNRFATAKKIDELGQYNRYDAFNFTKEYGILEFRIFSAVKNREQLIWRAELIALMFKHHRKGSASVLKMLFTDSPIKTHLLKMYNTIKYEALIDRVIRYTDIYMTAKDTQQTARIIIDHKNKAQTLTDAQTILTDKKLIK